MAYNKNKAKSQTRLPDSEHRVRVDLPPAALLLGLEGRHVLVLICEGQVMSRGSSVSAVFQLQGAG